MSFKRNSIGIWLLVTLLKPVYLRVIGWVFLAIASILSIQTWGFSIGLTAYFGLLILVVGVLFFYSVIK